MDSMACLLYDDSTICFICCYIDGANVTFKYKLVSASILSVHVMQAAAFLAEFKDIYGWVFFIYTVHVSPFLDYFDLVWSPDAYE